jgi:hypothetical protein
MAAGTAQSSNEERRRDALVARLALSAIAVIYFVFLLFYVPRLNNFVMSDREFTGWVGPIAERVARGQRLYDDLVLPIPPGSFVLLAAIHTIAGGALLLHELWVAAASHLAMGLMAYAIAAKFSTRKVALLVALTTLVVVTQTPKECVYDHTSLLVAWLSVLVGSHAALEDTPARRRRLWVFTGLSATATLMFKQSTAVGMTAGWLLALAYLFVVDWRAGRRDDARARLSDAAHWAAGSGAGLVALALLLASLRAPLVGFVRAVFIDGPALKGGAIALLRDLFMFTARNDAVRNTIVPGAFVLAIGVAVARKHGHLHVGDELENPSPISLRAAVFLCLTAFVAYGAATALLATNVRALDRSFSAACDSLRNVPAYGFVFGIAFFAANVNESHAITPATRRSGHALNAIFIASLVCSMIYDTSFVLFYPFYYNEPSIPIALLCLYVATERSGLRMATPLILVASLLPIFGAKFNRALSDDTPVNRGHWAGLRVNYRGLEVLKAAARAQDLAGETGSVLIVPEDVELQGLVHRPRPPLKGAILFVDQYPMRLLSSDLEALDRNHPDVVIVHPRNPADWKSVFHTWSNNSAAEKVVDHVLTKILPKEYTLDSSYPSTYFWDQGQIDVYVRKKAEAE